MEEFLVIGQIINTHGIKGELKIYPLTDNINRFKKLKKIYIDEEEKTVLSCKILNDKAVLKIDGVDSIESGLKYKNKYIKILREDAVKLPKGSYYVADLIGINVLDTNGKRLGLVKDVINTKNNDVYWVQGERELLIPALKNIVVNIDIKKKEIVIKPVEEWLLE